MSARPPFQLVRSISAWVFLACPILLPAAELDLNTLPPPASAEVDYARDIKPIFEASCFRCHGPEKPKSRFRLDNQETALRGGAVNTNDIVPFKSADSLLIRYVAGLDEEMKMPPAGKGNPLTAEQIGVLRAWIDQGAKWSPGSTVAARESELAVTPLAGWIGVNGSQSKFREDWSKKEGFVIGYENFELREPVGKDAEFVATGRAVFDQNDYQVAMTLTKPDLGFVSGGYTTYRKYYNDAGGYYAPYKIPFYELNQPPFVLNQELYVDNQKAWFNVGMTLPNLPKVVVGYEYLSRSGQESTLHWGQYYPPTNSPPLLGKAILPAYRNTDESTQIIKLDANYEVSGFSFEDNFRGEFYRLNQAASTPSGSLSLDGFAAQKDSYDHSQAVNAFRVEKQLRPWLLVSGGYLYTHLDGDASFSGAFGEGVPSAPSFVQLDKSPGITLEQHSHTINANALLGPWQGLTFSAGVQAEWQQRQGMGLLDTEVQQPGFNTNQASFPQSSNLDKSSIHEDLALRYTRIPFTVLYAEAGFAQEDYDLSQSSYQYPTPANLVLFQDTESTVNLQDYRVGFTISPWQQVSLDASYQYRDKRNNYQDNGGTSPISPFLTNGYPSFFRWLDIVNNDFEARLTVHPVSWLKMTLKYQLVSTEYRNNVNSSQVIFFDPLTGSITNIVYPGGELLSGNYDANIYSVNLTLTPWRRLYLSTSFSYSDSRTVSGLNNYTNVAPSIVAPYEGHIYSVLATANFALNKSTDLNATYSFSKANYQQDNSDGLPLEIVYDRNALMVGVKRKLSKNVTGKLQYAYYTYTEPTSGGVNNYRGNAVFGSVNLALP